MIPELVQALAWSLFGLAFGWYVCHALKEVDEIREAVVHHNGDSGGVNHNGGNGMNGGATKDSHPRRRASDRKDNNGRRALGIFMMILAVAVGINAWYSTSQDRKITEREVARSQCQAEYNADFAKVLGRRTQWAAEDKAAQVKLFKDFLTATQPGQGRKLLEDYLAITDRTDRLREQNPLPRLEDRDC